MIKKKITIYSNEEEAKDKNTRKKRKDANEDGIDTKSELNKMLKKVTICKTNMTMEHENKMMTMKMNKMTIMMIMKKKLSMVTTMNQRLLVKMANANERLIKDDIFFRNPQKKKTQIS